jgi:hypothetical protein
MKTLKNTIDSFTKEALTEKEMNFLRGGGAENPIDMMIPPRK